jgi:hypothetical protein
MYSHVQCVTVSEGPTLVSRPSLTAFLFLASLSHILFDCDDIASHLLTSLSIFSVGKQSGNLLDTPPGVFPSLFASVRSHTLLPLPSVTPSNWESLNRHQPSRRAFVGKIFSLGPCGRNFYQQYIDRQEAGRRRSYHGGRFLVPFRQPKCLRLRRWTSHSTSGLDWVPTDDSTDTKAAYK